MAETAVSLLIDAPREVVWEILADVERHEDWMADARSVAVRPVAPVGLGSRIEAMTRVGPFRSRDTMVVTSWDPPSTFGVDHIGRITGRGGFALHKTGGGTSITWTEDLRFPWYLGGRVTGFFAGLILRRLWKANLARLAETIRTKDLA